MKACKAWRFYGLGMFVAVRDSCQGQDQYTGKGGCVQLAEGTRRGGGGGGDRREIVGEGAAFCGGGGLDGFDPEWDGGGEADEGLRLRLELEGGGWGPYGLRGRNGCG